MMLLKICLLLLRHCEEAIVRIIFSLEQVGLQTGLPLVYH